MKQRFLLSLVFVFTFIAATQAQIGKGSMWLGGSIGFSQSKSDFGTNQKMESFNVSPAVGKAIKENIIAGVRLGYSKSTSKNTNSPESYYNSTTENYGGGIFIRQYVPVVSRLYIFGEATASYAASKQTRDELHSNIKVNTETKGWSTSLGFTPGVSYGVTRKLQLETGFNSLFSMSYGKSKLKYPNSPSASKQTSEGFSAGISLENASTFYIGFRLLINNKG